jgi:hypothetical protein
LEQIGEEENENQKQVQATNQNAQTLGRETSKNLNMLGRGIMGDTQERFSMGSDPLGMAIARDYGSVN